MTALPFSSLLTTANPKTDKGRELGYLTSVLHLAPASLSGFNVCNRSTPGCRAGCLNLAGRGGIIPRGATTNAIQRARVARTRLLFSDRPLFLQTLQGEIETHVRRADRLGLAPAMRLNGTSDLPWERIAPAILERFSDVQFYDYTKDPSRYFDSRSRPEHYHLTLSRSEHTTPEVMRSALVWGSVAVVYDSTDSILSSGFDCETPAHDADSHDLRFLDRPGSIGALRAKGPARHDETGFVVRTARGETACPQTLLGLAPVEDWAADWSEASEEWAESVAESEAEYRAR